jgi:GAF domain-containing protein
MKTRGSKTTKLKRGTEAAGAHGSGCSVSYLKEQLDLRTRQLNEAQMRLDSRTHELGEALEQQAATAEILRVISSSPTDLPRVFAAVAASATRLCDASDATIHQVDGAVLRLVAHHGPIPVPGSLPMTRGVLAGRAVLDRQTIHVADLQAETGDYPEGSDIARRLGLRTNLAVPLIKAAEAIGVVIIRRTEVRPFTDRQIDLLRTFATQAVIALENTRLFNAEQARARELTEALQQQTATADVLKVISRSTFNLQSVFDTLVESAARLCHADKANLAVFNEDSFQYLAAYGFDPDYNEYMRSIRVRADRGSINGRTVLEGNIVHVHDVLADPEFNLHDAQKLGSFRTALGVPLLREGTPVGVIFLTRVAVDPFTQQQIDLVQTFADQAVIAIENVRLFDEVQAHARAVRVSGAADGNLRGAAGDLKFARRARAGLPYHRGKRAASVRRQIWKPVSLRLRGLSRNGDHWPAIRISRAIAAPTGTPGQGNGDRTHRGDETGRSYRRFANAADGRGRQ